MSTSKTKKELSFFPLFDRFISDSRKGKRLQPNGKAISPGTVGNYCHTQKVLENFCRDKSFTLRLRPERYLNKRETEREKNYWKKFYQQFTDYMYNDCDYYDNYAGSVIKNLRVFFNYLNKELALGVGQFHKSFYVRKEEIAIFPLMPEELNYLIYNQELEQRLSPRMQQVKDVFVSGCTVALRVSDLLALKKSNLRLLNQQYYLAVRSMKTSTDTLIKLPEYAVAILQKYEHQKRGLLPAFHATNLNQYIKLLLEQAGFTHEVSIKREKRGKPLTVKKTNGKGGKANSSFRFCDVASTHTMRRTAITTMLCLGMPEQVVRKISGHAPATKEFYRYVLWAQTYQDEETEKVFKKLSQKELITD